MFYLFLIFLQGNNWGFHTCNCHYEEDGCVDEDVYFNTCNCDANLPVQMRDTGLIKKKIACRYVFVFRDYH